jgi:hypothetical protein
LFIFNDWYAVFTPQYHNTPPLSMNTKLLSAIYVVSIFICACNGPDKIKHKRTARKLSFFDSVVARADLSPAQVKLRLADTNYFPNDSNFEGDTVFHPGTNYHLVLLDCSRDKTSSKKYLLVFKPNAKKCTSILLVGTIDIKDQSSDFSQSSMQMFNDYQFFTRNVKYLRDEGKNTTLTVIDKFYQLNKNGGINQLKEKPDGVDVPAYDPGPDIPDDDDNAR